MYSFMITVNISSAAASEGRKRRRDLIGDSSLVNDDRWAGSWGIQVAATPLIKDRTKPNQTNEYNLQALL
jgi:hypothetical protein